MTPQENQRDEAAHPYPEEEEINLLDLVMVLVKHKVLIMGIVFLAGIAAVAISLKMTNIYRSEATLGLREEENNTPAGLSALGGLGSLVAGQFGLGKAYPLQKLEVVLNSRILTRRVIEKYHLMPVIFPDRWDADKKAWVGDDPPTLQDGWKKVMKDLLTVSVDIKQGTIKLDFDHPDPKIAKNIVDDYLTELSGILREEVIRDASENMRFFREELEKTRDSLLKEKIYTLLAKEIEKDTFARAQKYYGFIVLDPPVVPEKKIRPRRALICILAVVVALFVAIFLAFLKEYLHRLKTEDPGRYAELVRGVKFWKRRKGEAAEQAGT